MGGVDLRDVELGLRPRRLILFADARRQQNVIVKALCGGAGFDDLAADAADVAGILRSIDARHDAADINVVFLHAGEQRIE